MSSRRALPVGPGLTAVAGWDNPLMTFFAEVKTAASKSLLWLGSSYQEVGTPQELAAGLLRYVTLTPDHIAQLQADRLADIDRGPSPLQLQGRTFSHG
jgi:hypothetical protein